MIDAVLFYLPKLSSIIIALRNKLLPTYSW